MKSRRVLFCLLLLGVFLSTVYFVRATCVPTDTGTAGNDTINCTVANPPVGNVQGLGGDDTINIGSGVNAPVIIAGDSSVGVVGTGNDTIVNDGTVSSIYGDSRNANGSGNDTIINNGSAGLISGESQNGLSNTGGDVIINNGNVGSNITGDSINGPGGGNDNITNNGTVTGDIRGDSFTGVGTGNDNIVNNGTVTGSVTGDSTANSGYGNDNITNNGTINGNITGDADSGVGGGNDTIINNGNVGGDVTGDAISPSGTGSDNITNNGNIAGSIYGDSHFSAGTGNDNITNNGTVTNIYGDNLVPPGTGTGSDTITNSGIVTGLIDAGGGNDTVIIQGNNAEVGDGIEGGAGYDVLTFNLTSTSPEELQSWADQIYAANPNGGTLILAGHTYTWTNFEELTQLLFSLSRLNGMADPFAVYCSLEGGIDVYAIVGQEGIFSVHVNGGVISSGIEQAIESGNIVRIGSSTTAVVYATSSGDVQVNAPNGFSFSFAYQTYCGALPEPEPIVETPEPEPELPPFSIINQPYGG